MHFYDTLQKTTIEESPVLQLKINFSPEDEIGTSQDKCTCTLDMAVQSGVITLKILGVDYIGKQYAKTIRMNHPSLQYLTFVDNEGSPVNTLDNELFMVRTVVEEPEMDRLLVVNTSLFYCMIDVSKLLEGFTAKYHVYLFNVIFPKAVERKYTVVNGTYLGDGACLPNIAGYTWKREGDSTSGYVLNLQCHASSMINRVSEESNDYILTINGQDTSSGSFAVRFKLNTDKVELPQTTVFLDKIDDITEKIRRIPSITDQPTESCARLPKNLGVAGNPETIFDSLEFNDETYKELYTYGEYDMELNSDGYYDATSEDLYTVIPIRQIPDNLDTSSNPHTRISFVPYKYLENNEQNASMGIAIKPQSLQDRDIYSNSRNMYDSGIDRVGGGGGTDNCGYFKIVKIDDGKYCICDAATLSEDKSTSGPSPVIVRENGYTYGRSCAYKSFDVNENVITVFTLNVRRVSQGNYVVKLNKVELTDEEYSRVYHIDDDYIDSYTIVIGKLIKTQGKKALEIFQEHNGVARVDFGTRYESDFTISDSSTYSDEHKLIGAKITVNHRASGGDSHCSVNNMGFYLPSTTLDVNGPGYVMLHAFIPYAKLNKEDIVVTIEIHQNYTRNDEYNVYYNLGYVQLDDERLYITQTHTDGSAKLYWYLPCDFIPEES